MKENSSFISFDNQVEGLIFDDSQNLDYPIKYYNVFNELSYRAKDSCSYYIFVYEGVFSLYKPGSPSQMLNNGMFASINGSHILSPVQEGKAVVIEVYHNQGKYPQTNYRAYDLIGGPIEKEGRLKYIDGCTDSLLISPVKLGDPCFNHLHFPSGINQTQHTHPTHRIGIVADGHGECITPFGNLPLTKGMIFVIKAWDGKTYDTAADGKSYPIGQHAFKTFNQNMDVIAFHPDSDFGSTDDDHPMINRTIVDGVSANQINEIKTK